MTLRARFEGVCPLCDQEFAVGTPIHMDPLGAWAHDQCPEVRRLDRCSACCDLLIATQTSTRWCPNCEEVR